MPKNRIKEIRKRHDLTAAQLSRMLGVPGQRLRRWDRHEVNPPRDVCRQIAERYGYSTEFVAGEDDNDKINVTTTAAQTIPLYGRAAAGDGAVVVSEPIDYVARPSMLQNVDDCYAVMVVGNSMEPRFFEGEVVTVHPYRPVRPNDYCVVQYKFKGEQLAVCKRFVSKDSKQITLTQHNPTKEINLPAEDVHSVHYILSVQMV
tara:strand:+ start:171 stop:779 length:609 start_codon:yes stop_codon:yes gene_type:complete